MNTDYPERYQELQGLLARLGSEVPGPTRGFMQLHKQAIANGNLSTKVKELMALAIAVTVRCENCVAFHVHDALAAGATRDDVLETLGVALMMGGGPAAMYACDALKALDQFEKAGDDL